MAIILALVLFLSSLFRGWSVSTLPPELFGDEVDVGYQAVSLLKTGRDLYNQPLPTYIHSLSEWRAPLLMYATVPSVWVLGNTTLAVRLPEVILGALAPLLLYIAVAHSSRRKGIALLASLALAFSTWHILYSRAAFEVVLLLDLILLGTVSFWKKRWILASVFFGLTFYTYSTAVVFVPLWVAILYITQGVPKRWITLGGMAIVCIPFAMQLFSGVAQQRFGVVSIFSNQEIIDTVILERNVSTSPWERLVTNRPEALFRKFSSNYLLAFSPDFLFVKGDTVFRHSLQQSGMIQSLLAPFLLLGIGFLVLRKQWLWIAWLVIAPIPSALTIDGANHATRLFLMIPPLMTAIGAGIYQAFQLVPKYKKGMLILVSVVLLVQWLGIAHFYVFHYGAKSWRWWHVGYRETMTELAKLSPSYSQIFINNTYEPALERFLFWTNYSPVTFHKEFSIDQPQELITPIYDGFELENRYYFGQFNHQATSDGWFKHLQPGALYLVSQRDDIPGDWDWRTTPPAGVKVLHTTTNPYNQPLFYLVTAQ